MALVGEVGEVAEIFQRKGEVGVGLPGFSAQEKQHVGEELADVFAYLVRLADVCEVDLAQAFASKMQKNARKYPKEVVKGSAKKYTEYKQNWKDEE
jgi:dCTP diphosphatase